MKLKAIQLRKGNIIKIDNELLIIADFVHITPGKGQAVIQAKLKNIRTGTNAEKRFRPDEAVEKADLQNRRMEFLYDDGSFFHFMDKENYEQIALSDEFVGDGKYYLLPNTDVDVSFYNNDAIGIELPLSVDLKVIETEPNLKTATVTTSYKPATLETGLKTQIPPFIEEGEIIRIDTRDGKYLERAK
ncbi:MAG: elongation factor P [Calditrichaceae bacterium]|nr:elongation factor P [Calditrichaceae bacterium]MBN2707557.1 elongation factor P [Calditrichaceae bacterium]RQV95642.1 MAG: elongation factor P [Calditrichota bacterium]